MAARRFWLLLTLIVLVGAAVRVLYVHSVSEEVPLGNDATWYFLQSGSIADGAGYIDPEQRFATGAEVPTAGFPPLYPAWLAVVRTTGVDSVLALKLAGAVTGAAAVALTGVLGRRLGGSAVGRSVGPSAGRRIGSSTGPAAGSTVGSAMGSAAGSAGGSSAGPAMGSAASSSPGPAAGTASSSSAGPAVGLVAAALAAVSPMLLAGDGSLMTETVYVPIVLAVLLLADVARTNGSRWWWAALGVACGAAALTRQEALLVALVIVVPAAALVRSQSVGWRLGRLALAGFAMVVVVTPWVVRNQQQLGTAAISTASPATSLAGSNCDATYAGPSIGSWEFACTGTELRTSLPEGEWTAQVRDGGIRYARDHLGRLIVVAPAREARVWGLWEPADLVRRDADETRSERFQYLVWGTGLVTLAAGVAGIVVLARRGGRIAPLVGALTLVAVTALASYGNPRFRTVAEPALLIGTAVLVVALVERWRTTPADAAASARAQASASST